MHGIQAQECNEFNFKKCCPPVVPMFHVNAWGVPYAASMLGCKLVFPGPFTDGESIYNLINDEGVNNLLGVPTVWLGY